VTVEVAIAVLFKATFVDSLHRFMLHFETVRPRWREVLGQIKAVPDQ
jgi:hypothetical protein